MLLGRVLGMGLGLVLRLGLGMERWVLWGLGLLGLVLHSHVFEGSRKVGQLDARVRVHPP